MGARAIHFDNDQGLELEAWLELPDGAPPRAFAMFAHCFTCNKDYKAPVYISRVLADHGIATLRYDFPGLGGSEGDFAQTTFTRNVADVVAAARFLEREYAPPSIAIGHSLGGAATLAAAAALDAVRLVAVLAAPANPVELSAPLKAAERQALRDGRGTITTSAGEFPIDRAFFEDIRTLDLPAIVGALGRPLLIFQSPVDLLVPASNSEILFAAAEQPKSYVAVDGAGHLFNREADARYVGEVIGAWAGRYL
jgi:pimeloyl-ACP methyl ester carboxylesterase